MTAPLDDRDAKRLIKLLGMLRSEYEAERAAAGAKADELVRAKGLSWHDVIAPDRPGDEVSSPNLDEAIGFCAANHAALTTWERNFLRGINGRTTISDRQREVLDRLVRKCRAYRQGRCAA